MSSNLHIALGDGYGSELFDKISDAIAETILSTLKNQAVQEFFSTNNVSCPHCNHPIEPAEILPDTDRRSDTSAAENTASRSSNSIDLNDIAEAKELLEKVSSWSDQEIEQLPPVARKKVQHYQIFCSELKLSN